jgi:Aspartyl protease
LRRLIPLLVPIALAAVLAGCGGGSSTGGCEGAETSTGTTTIPVTIGDFDEGKAVFAEVCVDGKGPYRFFVDTGSAGSELDAKFAAELDLKQVGKAETAEGAGCSFEAQPVRVPRWSVAGVPLEGQVFSAVEDAPIYRASGAVGTIGSDVLARFGAVRFDYKAATMSVEGGEGKPPDSLAEAAKGPLPRGLVKGAPKIVAPMIVQALPGSVALRVEVDFGGHKRLSFIPDTGAARDGYIDPAEVKSLGLKTNGEAYEENSFCSRREAPGVESGSWSLAGKPLKPASLAVTPLIGSVRADGLLGGLTFDRYGSVVFDYAGGRLVLGAVRIR